MLKPESPLGPQVIPLVDTAVCSGFNTGQVTVTDVATLIKAEPSGYRYSLKLINIDADDKVYIGPDDFVTAENGYPIPPGGSLILDRSYSQVYGICDTGKTAIIGYLEEAR